MIKITTDKKGYKLIFVFSFNKITGRERYVLKRCFTSFEKCKETAYRFSHRVNRPIMMYAEAEIKYKVTGV